MKEDAQGPIFKDLFPTALFVTRVPDQAAINKSLMREIETVRAETPNGRPDAWSCNVYTTINNNFTLHEQPGFRRLTEYVLEAGALFAEGMKYPMENNELVVDSCWLNVYGRDQWQERHNHSANPIVAVYYVAAPPNCSSLILHSELADTMIRPRYQGNDQIDKYTVQVDPEPGMLVLFNGFLRHSVTSSRVDGERISIATNLNVKSNVE
ncbi:MAG: hypothetical protein JKY20_12130 [Alphaproteobacteria bacterium]|nr:hypothetical protein [Alphaproteobacteria bacterium]